MFNLNKMLEREKYLRFRDLKMIYLFEETEREGEIEVQMEFSLKY